MNSAIQDILEFFGLIVDTSTLTLGDCFVYMVYAIFAIITIYLLFSFIYGVIKFFLSFGGGRL